MAATVVSKIDPRQVQGIKRLRHLLPLLAPLHDVGCARDTAGNRELHFDEYVTLVLLYLMNPLIDSVRALQHAAAIDKVAEQLGVKRFSLGSFSESVRSFAPQKLKAVIAELSGQLLPVNVDPRLKAHLNDASLTIVDGTVLDARSPRSPRRRGCRSKTAPPNTPGSCTSSSTSTCSCPPMSS